MADELDLGSVIGSSWGLPSGQYIVEVDKAREGSKDKSCRSWVKEINGVFHVVCVEHY